MGLLDDFTQEISSVVVAPSDNNSWSDVVSWVNNDWINVTGVNPTTTYSW